MATPTPEFPIDLAAFSVRLLADLELDPRARHTAEAIAEAIPGAAVVLYLLTPHEEGKVWVPQASCGEIAVREDVILAEAGTLGALLKKKNALIFSGPDLAREDYAHLDVRRTIQSLAYLPFLRRDELAGAIEILTYDAPCTEEQLDALAPVAAVAGAALLGAQGYEEERNTTLGSISRLTQLYDLEKVFSSTLEMDELLPIIGTKFCEVLECAATNIWLLLGDETVELMHQTGSDPTLPLGTIQKPGEGLAGSVSDTGEVLLIAGAADARLVERNRAAGDEGAIESILVAPIMDKGFLVGVVEAVNKNDRAFDEDDLFTLTSICETAAIALHNASLLRAERKVQILETLVTVSHEITSTLNLERMLQTIVDAPQAVIPYERAAIALAQGGRFSLSAVTGVTQLHTDAPDIAPLNEVLQWAALGEEVVHVRQVESGVDAERPETRAKFEKYFQQTGMRAFYSMPLNDDTGRVGVLAFESSDPEFLLPAHKEILQVLSGQATVALRNAQMYKEVPFISLLEPVLKRKRQFMALEKRRRAAIGVLTVAAIVFFAVCPLPLRVDGAAVVAPVRRAHVQPEVEGVISKVLVREGEHVEQGQVLAEMNAWQYRAALAEAEARYQTAQLQMNRALAANNGTEAGAQRVQTEYWKAEVDRARELLERTQLRSPIHGIIATPQVEHMTGRRLELGDRFAEVVDASEVVVNIALDDVDASLLQQGQAVVLKMNSNALRTYRGDVAVVSPSGEALAGAPVFYARVNVSNEDQSLRTGMEGRGKVTVGWYPAGYVFFRRLGIWAYSQVWSWVGW